MKKCIFIIFLLFSLSTISAQTKNINIDNVRIFINYQDLPEYTSPLFFYYTKKVEATPSTEKIMDLAPIWDKIKISGQRHAEEYENSSTEMKITLNFEDFKIHKSEINEKKGFTTDQNGDTIVSYTYFLNLQYCLPSNFTIRTPNYNWITKKITKDSDVRTYTSEPFPTPENLSKFWNENENIILGKLATDIANKAVETLNYQLHKWYSFPSRRTQDLLKTMNEKKHPENRTMQQYVAELKQMLQSMTSQKGIKAEDAHHIIEYFDSIPRKYPDLKQKSDTLLIST